MSCARSKQICQWVNTKKRAEEKNSRNGEREGLGGDMQIDLCLSVDEKHSTAAKGLGKWKQIAFVCAYKCQKVSRHSESFPGCTSSSWHAITIKILTESWIVYGWLSAHSTRHSANCLELYHNRCMTQPKWPKSLDDATRRDGQLSQASWRWAMKIIFVILLAETSFVCEVNCLWILRIWETSVRWQKVFPGACAAYSLLARSLALLVRSHESLTVHSLTLVFRVEKKMTRLLEVCNSGDRLDIHPRLSLMVHWPFSFNWWTCGHPVQPSSQPALTPCQTLIRSGDINGIESIAISDCFSIVSFLAQFILFILP